MDKHFRLRALTLAVSGALILAACGGGEGSASALQGLIDFTLDPGERADVEFCCCAHVRPQSTLKPATELLSSVARPASSP